MDTDKLKSLVEFQRIQPYRTKAGKQKQVLKGIPKQEFWEVWRDHKEEIKAMGITLHFEKVNRDRLTATGQVSRRKGYKQPRQGKSWEVWLWVNERRKAIVESIGFSVPDISEPETDCPF